MPGSLIAFEPTPEQIEWARRRTREGDAGGRDTLGHNAKVSGREVGLLGEAGLWLLLKSMGAPAACWANRRVEAGGPDFVVGGRTVAVKTRRPHRGPLRSTACLVPIEYVGDTSELFFCRAVDNRGMLEVVLLGGITTRRFRKQARDATKAEAPIHPARVIAASALDRPETWCWRALRGLA
jgi:hypothetical protein